MGEADGAGAELRREALSRWEMGTGSKTNLTPFATSLIGVVLRLGGRAIFLARNDPLVTGGLRAVHLARPDDLAVSGFQHEVGFGGFRRQALVALFVPRVGAARLDAGLGTSLCGVHLARENRLGVARLEVPVELGRACGVKQVFAVHDWILGFGLRPGESREYGRGCLCGCIRKITGLSSSSCVSLSFSFSPWSSSFSSPAQATPSCQFPCSIPRRSRA